MLALKLALRNILGAGLKTWLNAFALSFSLVITIWGFGFYDGMANQIEHARVDVEIGGGQFWHESYDPLDPLTLDESHGTIPEGLNSLIASGKATPILITSGAIFPEDRMKSILIKGIDPDQQIVELSAVRLKTGKSESIPAIIGSNMSKSTNLSVGDEVTIRWRDSNGTFDATDIEIVDVFSTTVPVVDVRQVWIAVENLREMLETPGEATYIVHQKNYQPEILDQTKWIYRDTEYLLRDLRAMVTMKKVGGSIFYSLLMCIALLAIFDTQMLAVFRRRKEIGMLIALGMTSKRVVGLFTLEGALYAIIAFFIGCIYGIPLLYFTATRGITIPEVIEQSGMSLGRTLYPTYNPSLVIFTMLILFILVLVVSFIPARRIAKMKPTDALRGKIS